jgi:hypothetical protein
MFIRRDGMREITYRSKLDLPSWVPSSYAQRSAVIALPDSLINQARYLYSAQFGELASKEPEHIRDQFPSNSVAISMAQRLLDDRIASHNEPCVDVAAGYLQPKAMGASTQRAFYFPSTIHPKHLLLLRALTHAGYLKELKLGTPLDTHDEVALYGFQPQASYMALLGKDGRDTCIRYGTSVAKEVVNSPDGRPGYTQNFIVRYEIANLAPWLILPSVRDNLPENVRMCIKEGSIVEVEASGRGDGSMYGCSLPWGDW